MNPTEISDALEAIAAKPFDAEEFPYEFALATGNARATVSKLKPGKRSLNRSKIEGAVLLNKKFYCLVTEEGAAEQGMARLKADEKGAQQKPVILLATDGKVLIAEQAASGETLICNFPDLHNHFGFFLPAAGMTRFKAAEENEVDIKATGKLAKLYDALVKKNPEWGTDAKRHDLNQFMTRLVFCFFAEDVGIFPKDQFTRLVVEYAGEKGVEAHLAIINSFGAMNRPLSGREDLPAWTHELEYVNGGLFAGTIDCPTFDPIAWGYFKDAANLDWREINPDIFGSMIQSVADPAARSELGMHYTSVPNILKVLGPLFLDDLDAEIDKNWDNPKGLKKVLARLSRIRVFDPACGSGNFLVVAYRQLRDREMKIMWRIGELTGDTQISMWTSISLAHFHGIEITDFGAETAKLALFIAEYQANADMAELFGNAAAALPLRDGGHIVCGNSLRLDWDEVCPPPKGEEEVYIAGNPPFLGSTWQSKEQKADMEAVFKGKVSTYKSLDYVAAFFFKASQFVRVRGGGAALVSTNSICQGQSVSALWPVALGSELEVSFAHRSFKWANNAARNAAVTCVIVGLRRLAPSKKMIFQGEHGSEAKNINAYLLDAKDVIVDKASISLFDLPFMDYGNKPTDGGNLILSPDEKSELLVESPEASPLIRRFVGSQEVCNGTERYCLWITDDLLELALSIPEVARRVDAVRVMRLASSKVATQKKALFPHRFDEVRGNPESHSILIPRVTSERRPYLPVDIVRSDVITSDRNFVIYDGPEWSLALIASRMFQQWVDATCCKLKTDYSISNTMQWNTFPVPRFTEAQLEQINASARAILKARYQHPGKTIADLYDPDEMPENLREAHRQNDDLLESMYIGRPFRNDTERLEKLFKLYAARVEKLKAEAA